MCWRMFTQFEPAVGRCSILRTRIAKSEFSFAVALFGCLQAIRKRKPLTCHKCHQCNEETQLTQRYSKASSPKLPEKVLQLYQLHPATRPTIRPPPENSWWKCRSVTRCHKWGFGSVPLGCLGMSHQPRLFDSLRFSLSTWEAVRREVCLMASSLLGTALRASRLGNLHLCCKESNHCHRILQHKANFLASRMNSWGMGTPPICLSDLLLAGCDEWATELSQLWGCMAVYGGAPFHGFAFPKGMGCW